MPIMKLVEHIYSIEEIEIDHSHTPLIQEQMVYGKQCKMLNIMRINIKNQ